MTLELSGPAWCDRFPTERTTASLIQPFRSNLQQFIGALEVAGVAVQITATRRPRERAWLMHWSWRIAREGLDPRLVPADAAVQIAWWHGELGASVAAARAMVDRYGLAVRASLTSRHIEGRAVDMTVSWAKRISIVDADGTTHILVPDATPHDNEALIAAGRSYGVLKLRSDPPHWSDDGR